MHATERHTVSTASLTFAIDERGGRAVLAADRPLTSPRGRFFRLALVIGDRRDIAVHSEHQVGTVEHDGDALVIRYPRLRTVEGDVLEADVSVRVAPVCGALQFTARLRVPDGVLIREAALPIIELDADTVSPEEVLVRAEGLGRVVAAPREALYRAHTEYMVDDAAGVWENAAYPGELSMPWHGVQLPEGFLYQGRHDPEFRSVVLGSGVPPRGAEGELWLGVVSPIGRSSGEVPPVVVALEAGDWRTGAHRYRHWADGWYTGPSRRSRVVHGWQRIIMKHQFGEVRFRYPDLVDVYERGRAVGLDGLLLFGWWRGGFDRGYPVYEPDDDLGGAEELRHAIAEIRSRDGYVALYANGNLVDRRTAFAADHGAEVAKKDATGLDYVVGYDFAGEAQTLRHFSPGAFLIACHGSPRWRAEMARIAALQASLGADELFFDQTAYHLAAWPCYDSRHDHGERIGIEAGYRAQTLGAIRATDGVRSLGSEGLSDCMIPHLDYHHGWGFAFIDGPEAFPAVFRTAFPEPVISNRLIHDERAGWRDQLNYALVHNLVFDVSLHRGRLPVDALPEYAAHLASLIALRRRHAEFFAAGRYDFVAAGELTHVRLTLDDRRLDLLWNRTDAPAEAAGSVVAPHAVAAVEGTAA